MGQQGRDLAREEEAQKQRVLHALAISLVVGGGLVLGTASIEYLRGGTSLLDVAGGIAIVLIAIAVYVFNRRGMIRLASLLTGGFLLAIPTYYMLLEGPRTAAILLLPAGIIFADFLLGGRSGLAIATINVLLYAGIGLAYEFKWIQVTYEPSFFVDLCTVIALSYGLALVAGFFTREMRQALRRAEEREVALRAADEEKDQLLTTLQARDEAQRRLVETIRELGSPIIPLARGVIALPLIGAVDSERAQQVTAALLQGVAAHRATVAIVDITGVSVVDTAVAEALLQAARGVWLLGAEPVLTGIRAEVAQILVGLGLDLSEITTLATLQEGLEYARARRETNKAKHPMSGVSIPPGPRIREDTSDHPASGQEES